jgi:hypothetical protein
MEEKKRLWNICNAPLEIIDFTPAVKYASDIVCFNPSIAHIKDDLYLCAVRTFSRYKDVNSPNNDLIYDPNHPWLGSMYSKTWWNSQVGAGGFDNTKIFILTLDRNILQFIPDYPIFSINGVDARVALIQKSTNQYKFAITYNVSIQDLNLNIKSGNCEKGCTVISSNVIHLQTNPLLPLDNYTFHKSFYIKIYGESYICPSIGEHVEKNWSIFTANDKIYFSYGLTQPDHVIYSAILTGDNKIKCENKEAFKLSIFNRLNKFYNKDKKIVLFSCSTPAINFNGKFLGVGHVKYLHAEAFDLPRSNLKKYHSKLLYNRSQLHPSYVYLCFFYEFVLDNSENSASITRISPFFGLTRHGGINGKYSGYPLTFPSGLTTNDQNEILLSFGEADNWCECVIFKRPSVNCLLIETDTDDLDWPVLNMIKDTIREYSTVPIEREPLKLIDMLEDVEPTVVLNIPEHIRPSS